MGKYNEKRQLRDAIIAGARTAPTKLMISQIEKLQAALAEASTRSTWLILKPLVGKLF
jgi:hypothetical protein